MRGILLVSLLVLLPVAQTGAVGLPDTIQRIKPAILAVGTLMSLRQGQQGLHGTGFVLGGNHAITNNHVIRGKLDAGRRETVAVFVSAADKRAELRPAKVVARDAEHDVCLRRFEEPALRGLRPAKDAEVHEGQAIAFARFPILVALGLHPATHSGIVAAITPVVMLVGRGGQPRPDGVTRLDRPFNVFQLDAAADPGSVGSPVYDPDSGRILAVVNSTFVKATKETASTAPSGISHGIPVSHARAPLAGVGVKE